jgi:hypothetical protein
MELKNKMLVAIPKKRGKRNGPLIFCHDVFRFTPNNARISFTFTWFMEVIKSSYILVISAIVPPETPGTRSAIPIAMPFRYMPNVDLLDFIIKAKIRNKKVFIPLKTDFA